MRSDSVACALLKQAEDQSMCAAPTSYSGMRALRRSLASGEVLSPCRGIYVSQSTWDKLDAKARALYQIRALAELHPDWVFAGPSAGLLHGLWVGNSQLQTVTIATTRASHTQHTDDVRRIVVTGDTPTSRRGIRCTSFLRTIYDCVRISGFGRGLAVVDSAVRLKEVDPERLAVNLARACGHRSCIKRVVALAQLADGRSENGGESIARAAMMHLGLELPDLQREVSDVLNLDKTYRVDFAWDLPDGTTLYGELDGRDKYVDPKMTGGVDTLEVLLAERRREAHLTVGRRPVRVVRFSFAEVYDIEWFGRLLRTYGVPDADEYVEAAIRWP